MHGLGKKTEAQLTGLKGADIKLAPMFSSWPGTPTRVLFLPRARFPYTSVTVEEAAAV